MTIHRILIVGTGFMGNALANALFNNGVAEKIYGVEPNPTFLADAKSNNCYEEIFLSIDDVAMVPDLAIVCAPVELVASISCQLLEKFPQTLVSDIASVKAPVVSAVQSAAATGSARFIAGHPITGSDRTGPIQPPKSIFTDRSCVITPLENNSEADLQAVENLWTSLGSKVFRLSPADHDLLLGMTSHMPHAVASALSAALEEKELEFCGTGIRDTIRIAKSNPLLWKEIFVQNREAVLKAIDRFQEVFDNLRQSIETDSLNELISILEKGQKNRDALGN